MRGLVQPDSVSSTARARSASPRSRDRARAISTVRCSSVAKSGDCPAMPCTSNRSRQRISPPTVGQAAGVCLAGGAIGAGGGALIGSALTGGSAGGAIAGGLLGAGTGALIGNAATAPQPSGRCAQFGYDYNGNRVCTAFY